LDLEAVADQPAGAVIPVVTQAEQIAVEGGDAAEALELGPIEGLLILEPTVLEELLALEDHRDAGSGEDDGGAEGGALLGVDAGGVVGPDLLGHAGLAVGDL